MVNHETPGEREVQAQLGSQVRAQRFYERQMCERLSEKMVELIRRQEMMFVATADAHGNCDCSPRFGKAGFVLVLDDKTLAYPEYRGNGVFASLGNIKENPHVGLAFVDFFDTTVGLHVNGAAHSHASTELPLTLASRLDNESPPLDSAVECWVLISVDEAYIHCSKHVPLLETKGKLIMWGTDDRLAKSDDYFQSSPKPATQ
jgi:predicted pyridoxine 5'-phosphate oxidase superfamily flavin-nucleotide-binding protein